VDRRRTVLWASGISIALIVGTGTAALAAGAFGAPPVDRVGSFESISSEVVPSAPTTTGAIVNNAQAPTRPRAAPATEPAPNTQPAVGAHEPTITRATASTASHAGEDEPPEREPPERESRDD